MWYMIHIQTGEKQKDRIKHIQGQKREAVISSSDDDASCGEVGHIIDTT
jgi:DNA-binding FrmR family transcriptional regulator